MYAGTFKQFFMWCTLINFVLLLISAGFLMFYRDMVYRIHSKFFSIRRDAFDTAIYCFIGLFKILWVALNLVPWLALCIIA
jgi:hypothetical protein